jgi:DedD protein
VDEGLKKRLVGAAVLASLVVIFVPMLIDDPLDPNPELRAIPAAPGSKDFASSMLSEEVVPPKPLPIRRVEPQPEPVVEEIEAPVVEKTPEPAREVATVAPKPGLAAWVVKVGSFSNQDNADALVEKLREAGFQTPDAERIELRGKVLYRVSVGPMVRKEKAEKLLPEIDKVSGTKGQVARFR